MDLLAHIIKGSLREHFGSFPLILEMLVSMILSVFFFLWRSLVKSNGVTERNNPGLCLRFITPSNRWPMLASGICCWKLVRLSLSLHQMASPPYFTRLMSAAEFLQLEVLENVTVDLFNFFSPSFFSPLHHLSYLPAGPAGPLSAQALQLSVICINIYFILASNAVASSEEEAFLMCACAAGLRQESWHLLCRIFLSLFIYMFDVLSQITAAPSNYFTPFFSLSQG